MKYEDVHIKITNSDGHFLDISLPWDASIAGSDGGIADTWLGAFRTILYWQGFAEKTINEYLPEELEESGEPVKINAEETT